VHHEGDLLTQVVAARYSHFLPAQEVILRSRPDGTRLPDRWIKAKTKCNGKVERYQRRSREWAYGQRHRDSDTRAAALPIWLTHYNFTRNPSSLSNRPPISRVRNQLRHDT
jgi:hypothetical protein